MTPWYDNLIPALWAIWIAYWIIAAGGAKETQRHESGRSRFTHMAPMIAGAIFLSRSNSAGTALEMRFIPPTTMGLWIGTGLVACGLVFSVAARAWLGGNWSASVTVKKGHQLIRSGPYRWVRHPIYTGLLIGLIGTALAIGRWRALLGLALIAAAIARKIAIEERFMTEQFGEDYARYRAEVPTLIPFVLLRRERKPTA